MLDFADKLGSCRSFGVLGFDGRFVLDRGFVRRGCVIVIFSMLVCCRFRRILGGLAAHNLIVAAGGGRAAAVVMPPRTAIGLIFRVALRAAFFVDQGLPVGDRDLIVIGMDFAEGEEAVPVSAVIDESGLQ